MDWNICVQVINGPFRKPMFLPASTQTATRRFYYKTIIGYFLPRIRYKNALAGQYFSLPCHRGPRVTVGASR